MKSSRPSWGSWLQNWWGGGQPSWRLIDWSGGALESFRRWRAGLAIDWLPDPPPGVGDCNLGKNLVKNQVINLVKNQVKTQVSLEAEGLTGNLGFLEDGDLRILGKCTGDHWKSGEPGIWNLGVNVVKHCKNQEKTRLWRYDLKKTATIYSLKKYNSN